MPPTTSYCGEYRQVYCISSYHNKAIACHKLIFASASKKTIVWERVIVLPEVGVIGLGSVGWATVHGLSQYYSYVGFDIQGEYSWDAVLNTKIVFICVGTPMNEIGRLDCSNVDQALHKLDDNQYRGLAVVKSTVFIGFMDSASAKYPNLRMVYMPEFSKRTELLHMVLESR